jgi:hypothetical protein
MTIRPGGMQGVLRRTAVALSVVAVLVLAPGVVSAIEMPPDYQDPCALIDDPVLWAAFCGGGGGGGGGSLPPGCYEELPYSCNASCLENNFCSTSGPVGQFCKHYPNSCVSTGTSYCCSW